MIVDFGHRRPDVIPLLLWFGGYPEPFLAGNLRFYNRWQNSRRELVFHEDLRDLSRVQDVRGVETLAELLTSRVTVGVDGPYAGVDPLGYSNRAIRISAADLLSVLI